MLTSHTMSTSHPPPAARSQPFVSRKRPPPRPIQIPTPSSLPTAVGVVEEAPTAIRRLWPDPSDTVKGKRHCVFAVTHQQMLT